MEVSQDSGAQRALGTCNETRGFYGCPLRATGVAVFGTWF